MNLPRDAASRGSPELSTIIETMIDDPAAEASLTLGDVKRTVAAGLCGEAYEAERVHFESRETVLAELDGLLEPYGEEALAEELLRYEQGD